MQLPMYLVRTSYPNRQGHKRQAWTPQYCDLVTYSRTVLGCGWPMAGTLLAPDRNTPASPTVVRLPPSFLNFTCTTLAISL